MLLTRKGINVWKGECKNAFREVDPQELHDLEKSLGMSCTASRLYRALCQKQHDQGFKHKGKDFKHSVTYMEALTIFSDLECDYIAQSRCRNFGSRCMELLENYLIDRGLIE